jgi:hypothetical protein
LSTRFECHVLKLTVFADTDGLHHRTKTAYPDGSTALAKRFATKEEAACSGSEPARRKSRDSSANHPQFGVTSSMAAIIAATALESGLFHRLSMCVAPLLHADCQHI